MDVEESQFTRTKALYGEDSVEILKSKHVIVFGLGGVGGYAVESFARCGIGHLSLVDNDIVNVTNLNRQIIATRDTVGMYKTDVMEKRIKSINPETEVFLHRTFFLPETKDEFDFSKYDFIVDAIDTVSGKISLVECAAEFSVPIISSMGTANKKHPELLELDDIYNTSVCPLARVMRRELKSRGIKKLPVVYSKENPVKSEVLGSSSFVPPAAGLLIGSYVVNYFVSK